MGMHAARAKFHTECELARIESTAYFGAERPRPLPIQRLSTASVRHARFSQQSIVDAQFADIRRRSSIAYVRSPDLPRQAESPHLTAVDYGARRASVASQATRRSSNISPGGQINARSSPHAPSPYLAVDPVRTDYFQVVTRERHSWRAAVHLAAIVFGRIFITFGTGGLLDGFAPMRAIGPGLPPPPPPPDGQYAQAIVIHKLAVGVALTVVGTLISATGIALFARDTYQLGPRRALVIGSVSASGLACVLSASVLYVYGQARDNLIDRYMSVLLRGLGNFFLFYAVTNSFPSSEIVHGNVPVPAREQTRLVTFALGGAMMVIWAYIGNSSQNAPVWAREVTKALGISGLHIGASLSRTDAIRAASDMRALASPRAQDQGSGSEDL
jgi:hypothetical protein